jgi:hypothetical protein
MLVIIIKPQKKSMKEVQEIFSHAGLNKTNKIRVCYMKSGFFSDQLKITQIPMRFSRRHPANRLPPPRCPSIFTFSIVGFYHYKNSG